jgi:hypothetical protein
LIPVQVKVENKASFIKKLVSELKNKNEEEIKDI